MVQYIGRKIREEKHESVRSLAKKSTIAPSTISKWENGRSIPDLSALDIVAKALEVSPWQLVVFR